MFVALSDLFHVRTLSRKKKKKKYQHKIIRNICNNVQFFAIHFYIYLCQSSHEEEGGEERRKGDIQSRENKRTGGSDQDR